MEADGTDSSSEKSRYHSNILNHSSRFYNRISSCNRINNGDFADDIILPASSQQIHENEFDDSDLQDYTDRLRGSVYCRNNNNSNIMSFSKRRRWSPSNLETLLPTNILIVALIEHLCSTIELNPTRKNLLFEGVICELIKLKILSPIPGLKEFISVRMKYMNVFLDLVNSLRQSLQPMINAAPLRFSIDEVKNLLNNVNLPVMFSDPTLCPIFAFSKDHTYTFSSSRYTTEFEEMEQLGEGGYGSVYRVQSKFDECVYAVKKIRMKSPRHCNQMINEVKVLAGLHHPNIIKYNTAWFDTDLSPVDRNHFANSSTIRELLSNEISENSSRNVFELEPSTDEIEFQPDCSGTGDEHITSSSNEIGDNPSHAINVDYKKNQPDDLNPKRSYSDPSPIDRLFLDDESDSPLSPDTDTQERIFKSSSLSKNRRRLFRIHHESETNHDSAVVTANYLKTSLFRRSFSAPGEHEESQGHVAIVEPPESLRPHALSVILYIQMQLFDLTLGDWLHERNDNNLDINPLQNIMIFDQICNGVSYIHSKNLIHRDLKPNNIFLKKNSYEVCIGDFGLTRKDTLNNFDSISSMYDSAHSTVKMTTDVGTKTYASPEQLTSDVYTIKSDIYSLGIILFEMFSPFKTQMEKMKSISKIRDQQLVSDNIANNWPHCAKMILKCLDPQPDNRPYVDTLIEQLKMWKKIIIKQEQPETIGVEEHERIVTEKDNIIEALKAENKCLKSKLNNSTLIKNGL